MLVNYASQFDTAESIERSRLAEYRTAPRAGPWLLGFGGVGTGGVETLLFLQTKAGYSAFAVMRLPATTESTVSSQYASLMKEIKSSFGRTLSSLPAVFGVSKQTLYNWANGETPKEAHQNKLIELADAGRVFSALGFKPTSAALERTLANGKSFLQLLADGMPGATTAEKLVTLVKRSQKSRASLDELFEGRKTPRLEAADMEAVSFPEDA